MNWKVNGLSGGESETGTISQDGTYQAPESVPDPRVLTITAEAQGQVAGASVDILEKESLLSSLSLVQSIVFLASLEKLYTAELTILSTSEAGGQSADIAPVQESTDSEIFQVGAELVKESLANFPSEEISKMISFSASDGKEFLLLAAKTSGRIIRLDPITQDRQEVATGLNQPESMVIDPVSGDLLVAELDRVTTVPKSDLEAGLSSAARRIIRRRMIRAVTLFPTEGTNGIAVDRCTGAIFVSNRQSGQILEFNRETEALLPVFSGLQEPTRLLGIHRGRVSCPDSFHLLAIETQNNRILLMLPRKGSFTPWIPAQDSTDLAFLPKDTPFLTNEAILLTETVEEQQVEQRTVSAVTVPDLYETRPDNPPLQERREPEPEPEPEPTGMVEFTFTGQQNFVMACTDEANSRLEVGASLETRFEGNSEKNGGLLIRGSFTDNEEELCQGTGAFAEVECFGPEVFQGSFRVDISPSEAPGSPTNLAGSWTLTTLDETADENNVFLFDVTQVNSELSGSFLVGNAEDCSNCYFLPNDSTVTCPEPGQCSVNSPEIGTCTLTCDPATPNCGLEVQVSGTVR
ncbi:hypothetical protein MYX82_00615 [Acidobacteria bacterium AH-259-D05]|nr:hypothetical protein [Acidobacteria bacterium AH-259-D05]